MPFVDHGIKAFAKQVGVSAVLFLGLYKNLPENEGCQKILIMSECCSMIALTALRPLQTNIAKIIVIRIIMTIIDICLSVNHLVFYLLG